MGLSFNKILHWQPDRDAFAARLRLRREFTTSLNSPPRGIDNIHVDVLLSSEFTGRAELLVRHLMQYDIAVNYWGESPVPPKQSDLNALLNAYSAKCVATS
ncbi:MAG: hypothetical protein AB2813_00180 [Candidatus Sedimenticola endophacoides]